jgi:cellulose synthase/poly-beta-1,6-N-acetylglucosamine synthase-like glycosyltransferase
MDDDAVAAPDWCARLVEAFDQVGERVAAVGGTILPRWISPRPEWLTNSQLPQLSLLDWGGETRQTWKKDCVFGCNLAFRKSVLLEVGGFHTELGRHGTLLISNDEIDAMERIEARGYLVFYCPKAIVHHTIDPERLKRSWFRRRAAWQAVSDFILHEDRAISRGSAAARRVRNLVGQWLADRTKAVLPVKQEASLAYDLVVAALSGAEFLREPKRLRPPGRAAMKKDLRPKTLRAGARRPRR